MATAKKCDRCERYYDKNTKHNVNVRCCGTVLSGVATITDTTNYKRYDLCDECLDNLFEFLSGAKVDKGVK